MLACLYVIVDFVKPIKCFKDGFYDKNTFQKASNNNNNTNKKKSTIKNGENSIKSVMSKCLYNKSKSQLAISKKLLPKINKNRSDCDRTSISYKFIKCDTINICSNNNKHQSEVLFLVNNKLYVNSHELFY